MPWVPIEQSESDVPDYRAAFQPESNALYDYANAGAYQLERFGRGAQNLYAKATGNQAMQDELAQEQAAVQPYVDQLHDRSPVASFLGQAAPALATAAIPGGLLTQMGVGAGLGGLEYSDNQGAAAAFGGILSGGGMLAGKGINQIVGKGKNIIQASARPALKGEAARLAARADELGMTVSPGNLQDSLPLKQLEASIKSNPATSGVVEPFIEQNQRQLNKLALESIGEAGDEISGKTLADAADRIGAVYDRVARDIGDDVIKVTGLKGVANDMSVDTMNYLAKYQKRFPTLDQGYLTGKQFNALRQMVQKDIRNTWRNLPASAEDLQVFGSKLLKSAEDALPGYADDLKVAGKQWRNLKALEAGKVVTKGNVNPRSLDSQLRRLDKGGYLRSRSQNDYYDAVRIANQFGDVVGDSGTATRNYMGLLMTEPTAAAGALALRPLASSYYKSGGSPLTSGLLGVVPGNQVAGQTGAGLIRGYGANQ